MRGLYALALVGVVGCMPVTVNTAMHGDPAVDRSSIRLTRVAIVPNRLPLNLQDPEYWREQNWEVIADEFRDRGITVVDYGTSVRVFEESGLPVEDSPSAQDKYAGLAESLGVDAVIVPYYGTLAYSSGSILMQSYNFTGITTLQVYSPDQNVFVARIDATGHNSYTTWLMPIALASGLTGAMAPDAAPVVGLLGLVALVHDLWHGSISPERRWRRAFRKSIEEGLEPVFAQFAR